MSESNRVNIVIARETTLNETPATPLNVEMRFTSESLDHIKETVESEELRDDRQVQDLVEVGVSGVGDISTEFSFGNADDLIAAGLGSTWGANSGVTVDSAATALQMVAATPKIVRATGSWVTDGFAVNQWVRTRGFATAANNGLFKVSAVSATDLTLGAGTGTPANDASVLGPVVQGLYGTSAVAGQNIETTATTVVRASGSFITDGFLVGQRVRLIGFTGGDVGNNQIVTITAVVALTLTVTSSPTLTVVAAGAGRAVFGDHVRDGTTKRSFHIERQYKDLTKFVSYRGFRVGKLAFSITTRQIMKLAISLQGVKGVSASSTVMGNTTVANANKLCAAGTNVASVKEGGTAISQAIPEMSWEVDAGLSAIDTIVSKEHNDISLGTTKITGKSKLYFASLDYYDKFQNHTASSYEYQVTDADSNVVYVTFPTIKYSASPIGTPGKNQPLFADMSWQAIHNDTYGCQMMIDRIPV